MPNPTRSAGDETSDPTPDDRLGALVRGRPLVVVSNRQPYRHAPATDGEGFAVDRPTGGLTAALDPVMQRTGGTWIAWGDGEGDAEVVDAQDCVSVPPDDPSYRLRRIWLDEAAVHGFYYGFSNQVLWPICHAALTQVNCEASFWRRYRRVNERFADAVVEHATDGAIVWFQDYHLALAPGFVRERLPDDAVVMQFWHIPWPGWDTFRACPHARALLSGLLENDVLAFHVPRYRANFLRCIDAGLDDADVDWEAGEVTHRGHTTSVRAIPMGVPVDRIHRTASASTDERFRSIARAHGVPTDTRLAIGVDRLDYTKGIVERLAALDRLWTDVPGWRGRLTFVQNGSESRSRIPAYRDVQDRVAAEIDRINRRFGTDDWQPVVAIDERLSQDELYGLYRHADVAVVSAIRDGMNLVAQEYVAAQSADEGVLVLSDQVGAHDEYGEAAVTVSPCDIEDLAEAIDRALSMPRGERRRRMRRLRRDVAEQDLDAWLVGNLQAAQDSSSTDLRSVRPT